MSQESSQDLLRQRLCLLLVPLDGVSGEVQLSGALEQDPFRETYCSLKLLQLAPAELVSELPVLT